MFGSVHSMDSLRRCARLCFMNASLTQTRKEIGKTPVPENWRSLEYRRPGTLNAIITSAHLGESDDRLNGRNLAVEGSLKCMMNLGAGPGKGLITSPELKWSP